MTNHSSSSEKSNKISYVFVFAAIIVGLLVIIGAIR